VPNRLPFSAVHVERKRHTRWLRRPPVITNPVVVIRIVGSPRKINPPILVRPSRRHAIPRFSRMLLDLRPGNLRRILAFNLSHPPLFRRHVLRRRARRILIRPVHVHDRPVRQSARVSENRRPRDRRRLLPRVLLRVVHLHIPHRVLPRPSAHQV